LVKISVGADSIYANEQFLSITLGVILLLYCYQSDISGIKKAAYWGVLAIIFYTMICIADLLYSSWTEDMEMMTKHKDYLAVDFTNYDIYSCIACLVLSFSFHTYTFSIYEVLESTDQRKMMITSAVGIFMSIIIYCLVGCIGYLLYENAITDSILDNMTYGGISIFENIAFALNVVMSFPMTFSAVKHYVIFLIQLSATMIKKSISLKIKNKKRESALSSVTHSSHVHTDKHESKDDSKGHDDNKHGDGKQDAKKEQLFVRQKTHQSHGHNDDHHGGGIHEDHGLNLVHIPDWIEFIIVIIVYALIFLVAFLYPKMKTLYSFLGGTTANIISFILPAMYFIKFMPHKAASYHNILPFTFIVVGVVGFVVVTVANILSLTTGSHH
jgi:amino acid permease